jgi:ribosomal protein S12 methylthiotransferase
MGFDDDLIDAIASCEHVVPYVDMPLQHISDPVLKRMGRGVNRKQIEHLLAKLRTAVGDLTLRTTFIVGFPGETEKEFAELVEFVERFRFEALGVFEYSPEPGTPAAEMPGQAPPEVKAARAEAIMLAQQRIVMDANSNALGRRVRVLVDGQDDQGRTVGRHCGQAPEIDSECLLTRPAPAGSFVQGIVENFEGYDLVVRPEQ